MNRLTLSIATTDYGHFRDFRTGEVRAEGVDHTWSLLGQIQALFGTDPFPFGIEENRPTWEQMLLYTHQPGIAHRHVKPEEIFPKGIMTKVVI